MSQLTLTGAGRSAAAAGYTFPLLTLFGEVERLAASGDYSLTCGSGAEALPVEFVNNAGAVTISADTNWGNATADQRLLAVRVRGNLTIDATKTLTAAARKLGLLIFCDGDVTINGTLDMTARGANHSATGSNLTAFDTMLYEVSAAADNIWPAAGGAGGGIQNSNANGNPGTAGVNGQTGGGGSGGGIFIDDPGQPGSAGTCYTSGTGGGGAGGGSPSGGGSVATAGATRGGVGGSGSSARPAPGGGGAGNPGGPRGTGTEGSTNASAGEDGTGGVICIYASGTISIGIAGILRSNGKNGGNSSGRGGGASGGGSVSIYYGAAYNNAGTVQANGGAGGIGTHNGGAGGAGSIRAVAV